MLLLLAACGLLDEEVPPASPARPGAEVVVWFGGRGDGEIEPCG